jgi:hypothetical protein
MQKLISFDIGIKNMAYCIFDLSNTFHLDNHSNGIRRYENGQYIESLKVFDIVKWDVLNLMDKVDNSLQPLCSCHLKGKPTKKNPLVKICNKKAKYQKNGIFFCEKHASSHETFFISKKEHSQPALKKMNIEQLHQISEKYGIFTNKHKIGEQPLDAFFIKSTPPIDIPKTKKAFLEKTLQFFEENCFQVLQPPKKKTANETDLISIGRNMAKLLDEIPDINNGTITHVILENQISTIANRMKTIQGMLAQYFIMRGQPNIVIEFVSSSNKLKDFVMEKNTTYTQHKKDGIHYCQTILENNEWLCDYISILQKTKRDDLADCFLQGLWYLKRSNIITYAENLKINSVRLS